MIPVNNGMNGLDWGIIAIYLLGVVGLGIGAGFLRRKNEIGGEGGHYFLAGNSRGWIWQLSVGCRCCIGHVCWALPNVPMTK